jgi:hypothetical protein
MDFHKRKMKAKSDGDIRLKYLGMEITQRFHITKIQSIYFKSIVMWDDII